MNIEKKKSIFDWKKPYEVFGFFNSSLWRMMLLSIVPLGCFSFLLLKPQRFSDPQERWCQQQNQSIVAVRVPDLASPRRVFRQGRCHSALNNSASQNLPLCKSAHFPAQRVDLKTRAALLLEINSLKLIADTLVDFAKEKRDLIVKKSVNAPAVLPKERSVNTSAAAVPEKTSETVLSRRQKNSKSFVVAFGTAAKYDPPLHVPLRPRLVPRPLVLLFLFLLLVLVLFLFLNLFLFLFLLLFLFLNQMITMNQSHISGLDNYSTLSF